jgi:hypothetical protein
MNNIISEAKEAQSKIDKRNTEIESILEKSESVYCEREENLQKAINILQDEKRTLYNNFSNEKDLTKHKLKNDVEALFSPIEKYNRIIELIGVSKQEKDLNFKVTGVSGYKEFYKIIDSPLNDDFLNLKVVIYNNVKPKNKYSLVLVGRSIFGRRENLIKYPYSYRCDLRIEPGANIETTLKDAPTIEELEAFWQKIKTKEFSFTPEHNKLVEDYKWVLNNCQTKEWQLEYWLQRKEEVANWSHGKDTKEYKEALKEINKFKNKETVVL